MPDLVDARRPAGGGQHTGGHEADLVLAQAIGDAPRSNPDLRRARLELIDFAAQFCRIEIASLCADTIERVIEHAHDVCGFVADDATRLLVP